MTPLPARLRLAPGLQAGLTVTFKGSECLSTLREQHRKLVAWRRESAARGDASEEDALAEEEEEEGGEAVDNAPVDADYWADFSCETFFGGDASAIDASCDDDLVLPTAFRGYIVCTVTWAVHEPTAERAMRALAELVARLAVGPASHWPLIEAVHLTLPSDDDVSPLTVVDSASPFQNSHSLHI